MRSPLPVMLPIPPCPPCLLHRGGSAGGRGWGEGEGGWQRGRGLGRGQGTFHPPCHTLHYHMVLRTITLCRLQVLHRAQDRPNPAGPDPRPVPRGSKAAISFQRQRTCYNSAPPWRGHATEISERVGRNSPVIFASAAGTEIRRKISSRAWDLFIMWYVQCVQCQVRLQFPACSVSSQ